jgi:NodT family efflux transporter outer membrane factor (OMF) lipoprotein
MSFPIRVLLVLPVALGLLSACALDEPASRDQTLAEALPETTRAAEEFSQEDVDSGEVDDGWVETFGDAQLVALVDEAIRNNRNLQAASAQVDRAAATAELAGAALEPTVALAGNVSETGASGGAGGGSSYNLGLGVSWELDVWGRVRAGAAAAGEAFRATSADYQAARQSLAATAAKSWFLATEARLQVAFAEQIVAVQRDTLKLVETKNRVGQVPMQDVHLARADLASAEEALRQARRAQGDAIRSLEVLLGRYPSAELAAAEALVAVPPPIPAGQPSQLLERRPDLIAAERRVAAAFFLTEEAELARLPSFTLTAGAGTTNLTDAIGNLALGAVQPLFTGGAIEAQIDIADADQRAAIASYGQAVLTAFQEVEDALASERFLREREAYLEAVVSENFSALQLTRKQYEVGRIDLLSVLVIQNRWIASQISLLNVRDLRLIERVNLHLALGGSFEETRAEPGS